MEIRSLIKYQMKKSKLLQIALPLIGISMALFRLSSTSESGSFHAHWAFQDFLSVVYYPIVAVLAGDNPYNLHEYVNTYPVAFAFPLYLPATFLVHLPFGLFPPPAAISSYFLVTLALCVLLAIVSLRATGQVASVGAVLTVFGLILISRPGHSNLLLGQTALQFTLAAYLVVYGTDRPAWAVACGLAFCAIKPTFGVPLALLLLTQAKIRVVLLAIVISLTVNLPIVFVLAQHEGGLLAFIHEGLNNLQGWGGSVYVIPATSPTLVDAGSLLGRLLGRSLGMLGQSVVLLLVLGLAAVAWGRGARSANREVRQLSLGIVLMAVLLCIYHQVYDLLVLTAPFVAMMGRRFPPSFYSRFHFPLSVLLLCFLCLHYLSGASIIGRFEAGSPVWLLLASANGVALIALFTTWLHALYSNPPTGAEESSGNTPQSRFSRNVEQ